jgi:hypothetical protein
MSVDVTAGLPAKPPSGGASQRGGPRAAACHPAPGMTVASAVLRPAGHTASRPAPGTAGWRKALVGGHGKWVYISYTHCKQVVDESMQQMTRYLAEYFVIAVSMHNAPPDTAQVIVLPPLVYGAAFVFGLLLHLTFPLHVLPTTLARGIGVVCVLVSLPLAIATLRALSRAHIPVDPMQPTTALVTEGPFRYSRKRRACHQSISLCPRTQ